MQAARRTAFTLAVVLAITGAHVARAVVTVHITADNAYAYGFGIVSGVTSTLTGIENCTAGEIFNCSNGPETYIIPGNVNLATAYIYIAAWSDDSQTQGVVASFTDGTTTVNSGVVNGGVGPQWEVYPTRQQMDISPGCFPDGCAPLSPPGPPTVAGMNAHIATANAGAKWEKHASGFLAFGGANFPTVCQSLIPFGTPWMWRNPDPVNIADPFSITGAMTCALSESQEYLIFRIGPIGSIFGPTNTPTRTPTRTITPTPTRTRTPVPKWQICGSKFNDLNGNGKYEPSLGESGLAGWTINLVFGTPPNLVDLETTTDANGNYCFTGLAAGTYSVSESLIAGWVQTFPFSPGKYTVTVPPSATHIDFGNRRLPTPTPTPTGQCMLAFGTLDSAPLCIGQCADEMKTCCYIRTGDTETCTCLSACPTTTPTPTRTPTRTCVAPISLRISTGSQEWTLLAPPTPLRSGPAIAVEPAPGWTTLPDTQWISAAAQCAGSEGCPAGVYSYQLCWEQCGPLASSPLVQVLAENTGRVYLDDGTRLVTEPSNSIGPAEPETLQGFTPESGTHTLMIDVYNGPAKSDSGSATGMDLSGTLSGSVRIIPCPGSETCVGDCDGSGEVTVDKLIVMVNIALNTTPLSACTAGDADGSGGITIDEIVRGVDNALTRCNGHCHSSDCPTCQAPNRCTWLGGGCLCVHFG